jgi:hypothetical protein
VHHWFKRKSTTVRRLVISDDDDDDDDDNNTQGPKLKQMWKGGLHPKHTLTAGVFFAISHSSLNFVFISFRHA